MADTVNFLQNGYSGEVLEDLLTYTVQGNDTVREGLIHIKTGIQHRYTLPAIKLGNIIQDNVPTPQPIHGAKGDDGTNEYQFTERHLEPSDFMVYLEFNPRDYEKYWRFAQPEGNLVFRELDPKIQATMLRLLMDKKNEYIGNAIWTSARGGETVAKITAPEGCTKIGANKEKYFDGVIKRILDNVNSSDAEVVAGGQCIVSGTTELTDGAAVEAALYAMWRKCPKQIRKKTSLAFVVGWDAWDAYDQYISDKQVKYSENTEVNRYRFKGKRIVPVVGIPEHTMVLGEFSTGMDSNLWMGGGLRERHGHPENRPFAGQLRAVLFPDAHENGREHRPPGGDRGPYRLQEERITHLSSFSISTRGAEARPRSPFSFYCYGKENQHGGNSADRQQ